MKIKHTSQSVSKNKKKQTAHSTSLGSKRLKRTVKGVKSPKKVVDTEIKKVMREYVINSYNL